mmetsp:Transcript_2186/g.4064  ORF Transcript_2186/g.4064 Transcript_2186/m.4064 type:complete len:174 (+) Transcript_2186:914-1435(+)
MGRSCQKISHARRRRQTHLSRSIHRTRGGDIERKGDFEREDGGFEKTSGDFGEDNCGATEEVLRGRLFDGAGSYGRGGGSEGEKGYGEFGFGGKGFSVDGDEQVILHCKRMLDYLYNLNRQNNPSRMECSNLDLTLVSLSSALHTKKSFYHSTRWSNQKWISLQKSNDDASKQ